VTPVVFRRLNAHLCNRLPVRLRMGTPRRVQQMNQEQPAITTPEDERINNAVLQAQANLVQSAILMAQAVAAWEQWAESKRARIISL
jgi:hypothetical protein